MEPGRLISFSGNAGNKLAEMPAQEKMRNGSLCLFRIGSGDYKP
jgi:hypothetical protein